MIYATHSFEAHYCAHCGTLDIAKNGIPEAPCAKAPVPEPTREPGIDWSSMIRSGVSS